MKDNAAKTNITLQLKIVSKILTVLTAAIVITFGISVVLGWYWHIPELFRYQENTIAMVMNTAVSFVILGLSIIALTVQYRKTASSLSCFVFIAGCLFLSQHIFNVNLGIDQLLFDHYDQAFNQYPGRVAPNTAFCFMVAAISILLLSAQNVKFLSIIISGALSLLNLSLALTFISGYYSDLQDAYAWGSVTPMSATAAIGFILLSISTFNLAWKFALEYSVPLLRYMPALVVMCTLLITIVIVDKIIQQEQAQAIHTNVTVYILAQGVFLSIIFGILMQAVYKASTYAQEVKRALSLIQATFEATDEGVVTFDLDGKIVTYNEKFMQMWGLSEASFKAAKRSDIYSVICDKLKNSKVFIDNMKAAQLRDLEHAVIKVQLKSDEELELTLKQQLLNGELVGRVLNCRDITVQRRLETQLLHQSTYDQLTHLPNRALLLDILTRSLEAAKNAGEMVAVFMVDIDRYSHVNDVLGRSKGDVLLREIAQRLKKSMLPNCVLGRIGGDEFLIIATGHNVSQNITKIIKQTTSTFEKEFVMFGQEFKVSSCIGVACYPKDGADVDALLSSSDIAMMDAKRLGRSEFQFYNQSLKVAAVQDMELEVQLRKAILEEQFVVYYQPIIDIKANQIIGAEALVRWQHPQRGLVPPMDFISKAEDLGVINQIGEFVLNVACQQTKVWCDMGWQNFKTSVNVSAQQVKPQCLDLAVQHSLTKSGINPCNLELELTESVLMGGVEAVVNTLANINALGVDLVIDDFGTGYSSFNYLKRFAISKLKIDRSFISNVGKTPEDNAIVDAMVVMSNCLHITVLAEGIETEEQLAFLKQINCAQGQGFLFAKPMPAEQFTELLKSSQP